MSVECEGIFFGIPLSPKTKSESKGGEDCVLGRGAGEHFKTGSFSACNVKFLENSTPVIKHSNGKSPFSIGNTSSKGSFSSQLC